MDAYEGFGRIIYKRYQFALTTSNDNIPSVRFTDTFYDGAFYIVSYQNISKFFRK